MLRRSTRRSEREAVKESTGMRAERQAEQASHAGRYAMLWERRKPPWVSRSCISGPLAMGKWANTFRSALPGRYGQGDGAVRKKRSERVGVWCVTRGRRSLSLESLMVGEQGIRGYGAAGRKSSVRENG